MVYILDDDWDSDLRVIQAGTAALGLYARCGMYVARKNLDGFVPLEIAAAYGTPEWARKLVEAGLWETREGGYFMPDYLARNPTAEQARHRRELKADRQRRWLENQIKKKRRSKGASRDASHGASLDTPEDVHHLLPSPTEKEMVARHATRGAARDQDDDWHEDPSVIAEDQERLRLQAEANVHAIAEEQKRTQRGAALARAAIPKRASFVRRNALAELRAVTDQPEEAS